MSKSMSGKALVIQIGEVETRVACMELGAKEPQVQASAVIPTPAGAVDDGVIQNLEAMQGALNALRYEEPEFQKARKAVFVLCSTQIIAQTVTVPPVKNKEKMDQMLRINADMYFPVDIRDYQLTWQSVGTKEVDGKPQSQIQLWATPTSILNKYYQLANACGLTVAAVDYCGHSFATGINASFAVAKPVKASRRKKEAEEERSVSEERTTLFINLEKDHLLMTFVQEDQVLMQRLFLRSDYLDTDLNEMYMEMEYFHSMFPACISGDCIVSGSCTDDKELVDGLEEVAAVTLQYLHCEPDQIWCMCLGASLTELDFGDPAMNAHGMVSSKLGKPWQYVLVAVGGALLVASIMLNATSRLTWDTELQSLRNTQQTLQIQLAANNGNAQRYNEYSSLYDSYSRDWETIFDSVRTYNDNAGLILEEVESLLPKDAVVSQLSMTEESLTATVAFQEKEDVAYFLIALRDMQYATLAGISDLQVLTVAEPASAGGTGSTSSALQNMIMLSSLLGSETAPTEGSLEAAPLEGDDMDAAIKLLMSNPAMLEVVLENLNYEEVLKLTDSLSTSEKITLMMLVQKQQAGTLDTNNLTTDEKAAIQALLTAMKNSDSSSGTDTDSSSGTTSGGTTSGSTTGNTTSGTTSGGTTSGSTTSSSATAVLLEKYQLTEQDLINGLDNLTMDQFSVLDEHYTEFYTKKTLKSLIGATSLSQRQTAIRNLLSKDPLAMHQFFILMQQDTVKSKNNQVLMSVIHDDFWQNPDNNRMIYDSDEAMLDRLLPNLINILVKNQTNVEATEKLIQQSYPLMRKLAAHLAMVTGELTDFDSGMDFDQLTVDILSGKTKTDAELDAVVQDMLTPTALAYYKTIEAGTSTGSTGSTSTGSDISNILSSILGGNLSGTTTGTSGTSAAAQEPAGNFAITVALSYKNELIEVEQVRKGLDRDAKIEKVEVAE